MIPQYPETAEISLNMREELHPLFRNLTNGISEFTFANIYLFRKKSSYRISRIFDSLYLITGHRDGTSFFLLPFGIPNGIQNRISGKAPDIKSLKDILDPLFQSYSYLKLSSVNQARQLKKFGYCIKKDRDNFDYLYKRVDLAQLNGRKFHKKRNLIKIFSGVYKTVVKPITPANTANAKHVLEQWRASRENPGDYAAGIEALDKIKELKLYGIIVYIENQPVAYTLGEEYRNGTSFVVHFEKALSQYKGLYQYINYAFAISLPDKYKHINREQDLGDKGLRQAKMSYHPDAFIRKYKIWKKQ